MVGCGAVHGAGVAVLGGGSEELCGTGHGLAEELGLLGQDGVNGHTVGPCTLLQL